MANIIYENGDFELSSYLMQQSLEKSIKAFLLKKKVIDNPEELRHLPLHRIFSLMKEDLKKRIKRHQNQKHLFLAYERGILMAGKITDLFDDIRKHPKNSKTKIPMWKESLGIPLTANEQKIWEYWADELQPSTKRTFESLKKFVEQLTDSQYEMVEKKFGVSKEVLEKYASIVKDKNSFNSLKNADPDISNNFAKAGLEILKQFETSPNFIKSNPEQMSTDVLEPLIFVIELRSLIVKTVVHEDIGRYPIVLDDGKTSTNWYDEKHENLKELINQVEIVCAKISQRCLNKQEN